MLQDDRHKGRWLLLVGTLMLVLCGLLFAIYAKHHRPVQRAMNGGFLYRRQINIQEQSGNHVPQARFRYPRTSHH
jgi:hypothetical protein